MLVLKRTSVWHQHQTLLARIEDNAPLTSQRQTSVANVVAASGVIIVKKWTIVSQSLARMMQNVKTWKLLLMETHMYASVSLAMREETAHMSQICVCLLLVPMAASVYPG